MITQKQTKVNEIVTSFTEHKKFAKSIQEQIQSFLKGEKGERVTDCGSYLAFAKYKDPKRTAKLHSANFCKNRLCPLCSWRNHLKISEQMLYAVEQQDGKLWHIVLTMPNVKYLTKSFLLEVRKKAVNFLREVMNINNYLMSFEITVSKNGEYHPHYHILGEMDEMKAKRYLQSEWAKYLGVVNKWVILHCEPAGLETVHELTKYIIKFESKKTPTKALKTIYFATKGIRRYSLAGKLKDDYKLANEVIKAKRRIEEDNLLQYGNYELEFYKWFGQSYKKID